jgi:tetratricopeptide (TPR) repeat protein
VVTLRQLGRVRLRRGDAAGARAAIAEAMALQAAGPPDDAALWETLVELAQVFHAAGDLDSARLVTAGAMALFDSIPPDEFADARAALARLSTLLGYSRDWDALERIHARVVAAESTLAGPSSEPVATAYRAWARTRRLRGDTAAADSMLRLAVEIHRGLGMRAVSAGGVLADLSLIASARGETARADSLQAASIAVLSARLGDDHSMVISARGQRATLLHRTGRVSEAIPVYRDVVAAYRRRDPPPPELPVAQWRLAEALREAGRLDEARPVFAEALRAHEERFPPDYILTANVRRDYGRTLIESGRSRDAVPILRQAVAVLARRWGEDDARTNEARALLARAEGR